jgi:mono/diheme cytochrome c family protein
MVTRALPCLCALLLSGCYEMQEQPRGDTYDASPLFPDGKIMQAPPDGSVARGDLATADTLARRPPVTMALLERGRDRFAIYCMPCHDAAATGNGIVPSRGFPHPPSFHIARLRDAPSRHFVDVIGRGYGAMASYGDRVAPQDRWAIAAYIRALQLSQDVAADTLAPAQRAALDASDAH